MKIKRYLVLGLAAISLVVGTVSGASLNKHDKPVAATSHTGLLNLNGNVYDKYYLASGNPSGDSGAFTWSDSNFKTITADNLKTNDLSSMSDSNANSVSNFTNGTFKSNITSNLTHIEFLETKANKHAVGLYIPITFYVQALEAYSTLNYSLNVTVTLSGGTSNNFASAYFIGIGSYGTDAYKAYPTNYYIPKNATALNGSTLSCTSFPSASTYIKISHSGQTTASSGSTTINNLSISNTTDTARITACYYGGLYICARADSSSKHQLDAVVSVSLSNESFAGNYEYNSNTYSTLASAISAASDGGTVTLAGNTTESASVTVNKNIKLDLNGYTLDMGTNSLIVSNGKTLEISSPSSVGNITSAISDGFVIKAYGSLKLNYNVNITNTCESSSTACGVYMGDGGSLNSATITAPGHCLELAGGALSFSFNGTTFTSSDAASIHLTGGTLSLYGSTLFKTGTGCARILLDPTNSPVLNGRTDSSHYMGGISMSVELEKTPEPGYVVAHYAKANAFRVLNENPRGYKYKHNSSAETITYDLLQYNLSVSVSNCHVVGTISYNWDVTANVEFYIAPDDGYALPSSIKVQVNGGWIDSGFSYNSTTGNVWLATKTNSVYTGNIWVYSSDAQQLEYHVYYDPGFATGNCTGSTVDSTVYHYNDVAEVLDCGFVYPYHTFYGWSTTSASGDPTLWGGSEVTMTGDVTLYAVWRQSNEQRCDEFCDNYLKMATYDTELDNSEGTGECLTYYAGAKEKFNSFDAPTKNVFCNSASYADGRARLAAWAIANGEVFDPETQTISSSRITRTMNTNDTIIFIAIGSMVGVSLVSLYLFTKKKKYN